jgi:hypothetical protein
MIRTLLCAAVALVLFAGNSFADEKKPEVKKPDAKPGANEEKKPDAKPGEKKPDAKPTAKPDVKKPDAKPTAKPDKKPVKGTRTAGKVKKIDAASGKITIETGKKNNLVEKEFTIGPDAKVLIFDGDGKKEGTAKDGLKDIKEGANVIVLEAEGKVIGVQAGSPKKKPK